MSNASQNTGGTVASEERSALIGAPIGLYDAEDDQPDMDPSDATQQLLTSLGRFHRELANAADELHAGWAEECMNQLIDCVEVALPRGWSEMVEALTDAGRILQTYETAGRPADCVEFLGDAYELLCLMVGDLIVDTIRPAVMDQWRERYQKAVARLEQDGLVLISDDGEAPPPQVVPFTGRPSEAAAVSEESPFELPDDSAPAESGEELLPTLDELPPLEAVLNGTASVAAPAAPDAQRASKEVPQQVKQGPSRLVVEILDQLCEQLSIIESGDADAALYALDRFTGGVRALEREARDDKHEPAVELCSLMLRAARLAKAPAGGFRPGLTELGYAFCGAYMDAFREDDLQSVADWHSECAELVGAWEQEPEQAPDHATEQSSPVVEEAAGSEMDEEMAVAAAPVADVAAPATEVLEAEVGEAEVEETIVESPVVDADGETEAPSEVALDEMSSEGLLEAARRAAMAGDTAGAKRFALQAAGAIARDEVKAAEASLRQTKDRLKRSLDAMREARDYVGETEQAVQQIATSVNEGEVALGKARENSGRIAQQLSDLREGVAELERQIAELQERREQELEKVAETDAALASATRQITDSEAELAERRAAEAAARTDLETRRQTVNDLQRSTGDIEMEVDVAGKALDEKQKSFDDITEAVRQICGDGQAQAREEGLLF